MTTLPGRAGLQPERTALAWQRTAITATVVMLPLIVVNARLGHWLMAAVGSVAVTASIAAVRQVQHRFRQLRQLRQDDGPSSPFDPIRLVAGVTVLTALVALVTALLLFHG